MKWKFSILPEHDRLLLPMLGVKDVFRNTYINAMGED